jgi:capsid protein
VCSSDLFHAILRDLRDLDLLILACLKRMQIAACLAAFIRSDTAWDKMMSTTATTYGYQMDAAIEPGMMWKLYPGESIETLIPNFPMPELQPFIIMLARRIGVALGVDWQTVLRDYGDASYSSARTGVLATRQTFIVLQSWFAKKFLTWQWTKVMEDGRLLGLLKYTTAITDADIASVIWIAPGWPWVDPMKDAGAKEKQLAIGLTTLRDEAAALGKDWQDLTDQRLREEIYERDQRIALGLAAKKETPPEPSEKPVPPAMPAVPEGDIEK